MKMLGVFVLSLREYAQSAFLSVTQNIVHFLGGGGGGWVKIRMFRV